MSVKKNFFLFPFAALFEGRNESNKWQMKSFIYFTSVFNPSLFLHRNKQQQQIKTLP
jgi:hypothetical protein